jgi:hypothetical protein
MMLRLNYALLVIMNVSDVTKQLKIIVQNALLLIIEQSIVKDVIAIQLTKTWELMLKHATNVISIVIHARDQQ